MMRFPYMTNDQALYTMFTTGRQNATISSSTGSAIANPTKGQIVSVPDMRNGWGTVNLRDAFGGPGQLFGRFTVNTQGFSDVWSHNISDVAIQARQQVDAAEAVTWQATVVGNGWQNGVPPNSTPQQVSDFTVGTARANARSTRIYTGQLVKQGAGTLFLTGANTYTGSNTLSAGKLSITGSMLAPITVAGGTLGGTGTIAGSISMLSGMIWPGLSATEAAFINDGVTVAGDVLKCVHRKDGGGRRFCNDHPQRHRLYAIAGHRHGCAGRDVDDRFGRCARAGKRIDHRVERIANSGDIQGTAGRQRLALGQSVVHDLVPQQQGDVDRARQPDLAELPGGGKASTTSAVLHREPWGAATWRPMLCW